MQLQQRINALVELGAIMGGMASSASGDPEAQMLQKAKHHNGWFTENNVRFALKSWSEALSHEQLLQWTKNYTFTESSEKTIAIVMAGNIPLVGFHDLLAVLISGHRAQVKLSSKDTILLPYLMTRLESIEPGFAGWVSFTEERLEGFDAVIATGSNNTARYFEYYFGKYPNIIRKNRNGVAVLTGNETKEQLEALADDIFRYFGLGCRNVSKLFLPKGYDFDPFFNAMYTWKEVINDTKYINNYDYNKAVYLMSDIALLDNEFMLLKEDDQFASPISVVFYEYYDSLEDVAKSLEDSSDSIQCVVSESGLKNTFKFGKAQSPKLWDYADGVDTLSFLLKLP